MKRTLSTLAVFVTTLLLTLLTWHNSRLNADLHDQQRFERIGNIMADSIADRMRTYNHLLEQSRTFVSVTKELTPQIWREYVRGLQLPARYPDVQGIGFAKRLFRENLAAEEREIRKLPGFTDFAVWPPEPRPIYFPIVLLEPLDWRNRRALGFDMYSESKRRAAMDAAILSGEPRMSGIVVLAQETDQKRQPGFLIYTPVFASGAPTDTAEDKRSALIGFVYAPFRTHDLFAPQFDEISSFAETQFIDFEIFMTSNDGGHPQTHLLYDADKVLRSAKREPHSIRYRSISIPTAGQEFQLHVYALDGFQKHGGFWLPSTILAVGLAISSLLTRLVWLNTRQSERLEKSERQLRLITNALPALIAYIDPDSKIRFVNRIFETWFSDGQHPIIGQSAHAVMGAENFLMIEKALKKSLGGQPEKTECRLKTVKGQMLACDVHLIPDFGPQGRL
ncbi:MAG: CHASE domain-containing protein, partial [Bdellovibrionaceae bacterium]|nr:CHASE domain-containing protein [Pseudobdellovibrionaceae bacterium]